MIHHQLTGPAIASCPKCLNLNLCTSGNSAVAVDTCVQNLMTTPLAYVS